MLITFLKWGMLLVRVHPNPRPLKFILVGRLTAFRFLTRSSYLQAHAPNVFLLPRHGFPHCRQKDYLSASGWGEGKIRVSGFEPDPTSIVSPSSFVALPLGAFLRQAVHQTYGYRSYGRCVFCLHTNFTLQMCPPTHHAVSARPLALRTSSVGFRETVNLSKNYYNIPHKPPSVKRFFNFFLITLINRI